MQIITTFKATTFPHQTTNVVQGAPIPGRSSYSIAFLVYLSNYICVAIFDSIDYYVCLC